MARFLIEPGALFQHIPRTGGTFVETAIDDLKIPCNRWISKQPKSCPKKHSLFFHYHHDQKKSVRFVFTFVRHPVDYYSSVWRYLHDARLVRESRLSLLWTKHSWHPFRQAALLYKPDFAEWVDALLETEPAWATRLIGWYVGPEGGEFANFIGRTETLTADLANLLVNFGYQCEADALLQRPRLNLSFTPPPAIPDELRNRICREERVLIRRFYGTETATKRWYGPVVG